MPFGYTDQTGCGTVWYNWTQSATTNVTSSVWYGWVTGTATGYVDPWGYWNTTQQVVYSASPPAPLTPEQEAERQRRAEEARRVADERAAAEKVKRERAKKLLEGALAHKQRQELQKHGYFHVETKDGARRYRLAPGSPPRRVHGEDGRQWSYCIHPDYGYPPEDVVLAQKLLLETDEDAFLRIANASAVRA